MVVDLADPRSGLDGVAESEFLAVPDHAPSEVVADHDDDGKLLPDGVLEFHEIEAYGTVSDHQTDPLVGIEQLRGIGVRQSHAETSKQAGVLIVSRLAYGSRHPCPDRRVASVGDDDVILAVHEIVDLLGEPERMNRYVGALPVGSRLGLAVHIRLLEHFDPSLESLLQPLTDSLLVDDLIACLEKAPDVAEDGQIDAPVPADLFRLDVHLDQLCVLVEQLAEDVVEADPCTQEDDQVCAHVGEHGRSRPDRKGGFETEGVGVRNGSPARGAGEGGHAGLLDELDEILCAVRVPGTATGDHDRLLCSLDHLHQARRVLVVHGAGRDPRRHVPDPFRVREGVQNINRIFQIHGTRTTAYCSSIGEVQELRDALRLVTDQGLLHHRFDDRCLVHVLEVELFDRLDSDAA